MLKAFVIGHLGKDATVNQVNGKAVINFSVAHSEKFKDAAGQAQTRTTWVECSYWTDRTAIAPYLLKGTQVFVEGQPNVDTYKNRDQVTMAAFRLRVEKVQLLGSKNESTPVTNPNGFMGPKNEGIPVHSASHTTNGGSGYPTDVADDLPF